MTEGGGKSLVPGPPDFVGLGVMRSGTSWLHQQLTEHPEVFDIGKKELHVLNRYFKAELTDEAINAYHRRFARPKGMLAGEWTPRYLVDAVVAPTLARAAPEARLLVLLRDPLARIGSHLRWRPPKNYVIPRGHKLADAVHRCHYHAQLQHLLGWFPRSQVLVMQFEQLVTDPVSGYRRALEHIGVQDTSFVPETIHRNRKNHASPRVINDVARDAIVHLLRPEIARLAADFGDSIDMTLWPAFAEG